MTCRRATSGHWLGMVILMVGLGLSVAGVTGPWWRRVDHLTCAIFEGLWQQCTRCWHATTRCTFSHRDAGVWRAIQALHILSLLCLTCAMLCSALCGDKRRCTRGKCPTPAMAAVIGGATGLLANLLFVGYIERHVQHEPRERLYACSFAMALTGSLLSLLASLVFSLSKALCVPKFRSQSAEPYWPYNHCSISIDAASGCPQYLPYSPCPYPVVSHAVPANLNVAAAVGVEALAANEKRKMFEQYRQARVHLRTEEEKVPAPVCGTACPCSAGKVSSAGDGKAEPSTERPTGENTSGTSQGQIRSAGLRENEGNLCDACSAGNRLESSAPQSDHCPPKGKALELMLTEGGGTSLPGCSREQCQQQGPVPPVVVLTVDATDQRPSGQFIEQGGQSVFTVEKAFREFCGTREQGSTR